jgi:hypothetical protein
MAIMTNPQRALQLWSVLALAAETRTILTYEEVSDLTGLPHQCADVLGHVNRYCAQNGLPLLPTLVVDKHTGKPSTSVYDGIEIPAEQRRCFDYDWLKHGVPSPEELERAYKAGMAAA